MLKIYILAKRIIILVYGFVPTLKGGGRLLKIALLMLKLAFCIKTALKRELIICTSFWIHVYLPSETLLSTSSDNHLVVEI